MQTNVDVRVSRVEQSDHCKLNSDESSVNLAAVCVEFLTIEQASGSLPAP
jgi:hypothetical protein